MRKRILLLILITAVLLCGCEAQVGEDSVIGAYGVSDEKPETEPEINSDVTLLYYPDMDTNPVTTTCLANNQILKLVYRPLIRANESFKPECVLAESFSQNGKVITVLLKSDLKFSDGTAVTANDAVKSINLAKKTETSPYYSCASLIDKCYAEGERTVVVKLEQEIADGAVILDIPIMKNGKEGIGCGPYKLSELSGKKALVANEHYMTAPSISALHLVETKTDEYVATLFSAGELDLFSQPGSDDMSLTSLRNYSTVPYSSNNMVYIGVNTNSGLLNDAKVRVAISACIDRSKIAKQTFVDHALPTAYPINPDYYKMTVNNLNPNPESGAKTDALQGKKLKLVISDSSDTKLAIAQIIAENFKVLGAELEIKALESEKYVTAVKNGECDLYLGETALPKTMDSTFLYKTGGSMNYFGYSDEPLDSAADEFYKTGNKLDVFLESFSQSMPIIPIVFRKNVMYASADLEGFTGQTAWDSLGRFENVKQK